MNYTIAKIDAMTSFSVELSADGNKRYITLTNNQNGERFISKNLEIAKGEELFWKVSREVVEFMHSWSDWVEELEEA